MTIKFLCPNGHQLTCGDDRAGKPAKCPKCGTAFVVPDQEEIEAAASNGQEAEEATFVPAGAAAEQSGKSAKGAAGASGKSTPVTPGSASGIGSTKPNPADIIVFLCPNGHRLNGPKSLQGKAGQCPHCGEKFRIPTYEEEPAEEPVEEFPAESDEDQGAAEQESAAPEAPAEDDIPVGLAVEQDDSQESEAVETFPEEVEIVEMVEEVGLATAAPAIPPLPPGPSHQLFDVFSRLWSLRPEDAAVELRLADGATLRPTKFSPALSRQSFGVFAVPDENGGYRVHTIAWSAVERVEFLGLDELPPGVFS